MSLSMLSPEAELLLLTAGRGASGGALGDRRIGELLGGKLDWEKLGWLAERERAAPVIWERLQAVGGPPGELPPQAAHLQHLAMVSEFRMLHLEQRLAESLAALERAGIEVMLLKGAALAITVYGSFVRRPMVDLDLLVRDGEAGRARAVLLEAGWVASGMEEMESFYRGHHHLAALTDGGGLEVQLEIHTGLFFEGNPFRFPVSEIWARAVPIEVRGSRTFVPGVQDQLVHLCLHFAWSHMMTTGAWRAFRDLRTLIDGGGVRWDEFVALAQGSRGGSCCYWTLRLAKDLVGVDVPDDVLRSLRPPLSAMALDRVERHFTYHLLPTEALCPSIFMARTMWRWGVRPRRSGHGSVRPWDRNEELLVDGRRPDSGVRRALNQLRNVRGWTRYVRSVLLAER